MEIMNIFPRLITENVGSFKSKLNNYFDLIQKGVNINNKKDVIENLAGGYMDTSRIHFKKNMDDEKDRHMPQMK